MTDEDASGVAFAGWLLSTSTLIELIRTGTIAPDRARQMADNALMVVENNGGPLSFGPMFASARRCLEELLQELDHLFPIGMETPNLIRDRR